MASEEGTFQEQYSESGEEEALAAAEEKADIPGESGAFNGVAGIGTPRSGEPGAGFPSASGRWGAAHNGDCIEVLRTYPSRTFDALITDPPAGIDYMDLAFDSDRGGRDGWVGWLTDVMAECLRVLKPGAHAFVWSIPRTSHWTATAIEDAGFSIRDRMTHLFDPTPRAQAFLDSLTEEQKELLRLATPDGSAFLPIFGNGYAKGRNIEKMLDEAAGMKDERRVENVPESAPGGRGGKNGSARFREVSLPASEEARRFYGTSTSIKPAAEFWVVAQRPTEKVTSWELAEITGWRYKCSEREVIYDTEEGRRLRDRYGLAPFNPSRGGRANGTYYYLVETRHALREGDRSLEVLKGLKGTRKAEAEMDSWRQRPFTLSSVETNALKWSTGGLNVGRCRVGYEREIWSDLSGNDNNASSLEARDRKEHSEENDEQEGIKPSLEAAALNREPAHLVITHAAGCKYIPREDAYRENVSLLAEEAGGERSGDGHAQAEYRWKCVEGCPAYELSRMWDAADPSSYFNQFPAEDPDKALQLTKPGGHPHPRSPYGYFPKAHVGERNAALHDNLEAEDTVGGASMRWRSMTGKGPLAEDEKAPQKGANTHACLHPESRVLTCEGMRAISEVSIGDHVYTHDGLYREVIDLSSDPCEDGLVEISAERHSAIEPALPGRSEATLATTDHPFLVYRAAQRGPSVSRLREGAVQWRRADDLIPGDLLLTPYRASGEARQRASRGTSTSPDGSAATAVAEAADLETSSPAKLRADRVEAEGRTYSYRRLASVRTVSYRGAVINLTVEGAHTFQTAVGMSHNTVKPLSLMRHLIRLSTLEGGMVLDPFMGSGSTLCAAVEEGRRAVGIEMDPHHFKVSVERTRYYISEDIEETRDSVESIEEREGSEDIAPESTSGPESEAETYYTQPEPEEAPEDKSSKEEDDSDPKHSGEMSREWKVTNKNQSALF